MAAGLTPTIIDPKVLRQSQFLTTAIVTQYTAPAGEAGAMVKGARVAFSGQKSFDRVWHFDDPVYTDETTDASDADASDVSILQTNSVGTNDRFYVGMTSLKFSHIAFALGTLGTTASAIVCAYWTGAAWTDLTLATNNWVDGTDELKLSGEISFTPPADWATTAVNGVTCYYIQIRVITTNYGVAPLATTVKMGTGYSPTVTFYKVPNGQTAGDSYAVCKTLPIPSDGSSVDAAALGLLDAMLDASDFIAASCSCENQVTFSADGAEFKDA